MGPCQSAGAKGGRSQREAWEAPLCGSQSQSQVVCWVEKLGLDLVGDEVPMKASKLRNRFLGLKCVAESGVGGLKLGA